MKPAHTIRWQIGRDLGTCMEKVERSKRTADITPRHVRARSTSEWSARGSRKNESPIQGDLPWRQPMITISAFKSVPDFARGQVRDLRARWALEEVGLPYNTRLLDQGEQDNPDYRALQPFGQVPI